MVCFTDSKSEFIVKILAFIQFLLKIGNVGVAIIGIINAVSDRNSAKSGSEKECECILQKQPTRCELVEHATEGQISMWDPLFISTCLWMGVINFLLTFRDVTRGTSRLLNALVLFFTGCNFVGLGHHFDEKLLTSFGMVSGIVSLVLVISVPICGRTKTFMKDDDSRLLEHDEFAQANGVFSSLND